MANVAFKKPIEEPIRNAEETTDSQIVDYTENSGFAAFRWPSNLTVDLGDCHTLYCIRLLLWDGLGEEHAQRASRIYKYRLLTSVDHQVWKVIFDTCDDGFNGWQVFNFPNGFKSRYLRINGLWNSANQEFHVVQIEAYNSNPPPLNAEVTLERTVISESLNEELGDGFPLKTRVLSIINSIEQLVESTKILNPEPFRELIAQLRSQMIDVSAIEKSMDSIRREIIGPVKVELNKSRKLGKFSFWGFLVGLIGGALAIISLIVYLFSK
jgi:hypothetical protein